MKRILFVCPGNICRSPLAEALLKRALHERAVEDVSVESAGTGAWDGAPASEGAYLVALERGHGDALPCGEEPRIAGAMRERDVHIRAAGRARAHLEDVARAGVERRGVRADVKHRRVVAE